MMDNPRINNLLNTLNQHGILAMTDGDDSNGVYSRSAIRNVLKEQITLLSRVNNPYEMIEINDVGN